MLTDKRIEEEIKKAESSRSKGNEGMSRVCARRAAGYAIREYLASQNIIRPEMTNYELMEDESIKIFLPSEALEWLDHLTLRVDTQHNLPEEIDLISDARQIIELLNSTGRIN